MAQMGTSSGVSEIEVDKDKLLQRSLDNLTWMTDDIKWRFDIDKPGNAGSGGYSPDLKRAMELRKELENYFKQGNHERKTNNI